MYSCEAYFAAIMASNLLLAGVNTIALVLPLYLCAPRHSAPDGTAAPHCRRAPPLTRRYAV